MSYFQIGMNLQDLSEALETPDLLAAQRLMMLMKFKASIDDLIVIDEPMNVGCGMKEASVSILVDGERFQVMICEKEGLMIWESIERYDSCSKARMGVRDYFWHNTYKKP